jgi:hypothetical protein
MLMLAAERLMQPPRCHRKSTTALALCDIQSVISSTAKRNEEPTSVPQLQKCDAMKKLAPINE